MEAVAAAIRRGRGFWHFSIGKFSRSLCPLRCTSASILWRAAVRAPRTATRTTAGPAGSPSRRAWVKPCAGSTPAWRPCPPSRTSTQVGPHRSVPLATRAACGLGVSAPPRPCRRQADPGQAAGHLHARRGSGIAWGDLSGLAGLPPAQMMTVVTQT